MKGEHVKYLIEIKSSHVEYINFKKEKKMNAIEN
jgi:hypothetical protein